MKREIIIGTRKSGLAMQQARWVCSRLQEFFPGYDFQIKGMKTTGDNIQDVALAKIGDKGLFTKELELALERKEIDLAVHSMKDLPTELPDGMAVGAVTEREFPGDVMIAPPDTTVDNLPRGARLGTSSLRRQAQLLYYRPDLNIVSIRGNINTRVRKLDEQNLNGVILAHAGVYRMGWEHSIAQVIPYSICLPAVSQGALGIEIREGDTEIQELVKQLHNIESGTAITAERSLMRTLEGGCQVPIGALARVKGEKLHLEAVVSAIDGSTAVRQKIEGSLSEAGALGRRLAHNLLDAGAGKILDEIRRENDTGE